MVGWFGAAALALVGSLKGQGSPWRQIPLVGVLAATALFISWRVRQSREKDSSKAAGLDDNAVVEVNTRVYLVYDEEKKLECPTSVSHPPPTSSERDSETFIDTNDLGSTAVDLENIAEDSSPRSQREKRESENRAGGESLSKTANVSTEDAACDDGEEMSAALITTHGAGNSASRPSPSPECKLTDVSVSGLLLPQVRNQMVIHPKIPSIVEKGEPYVYELDTDSVKDVTEDSHSFCPVANLTHLEKDIIPVVVSDFESSITPEYEYSYVCMPDGDSKQVILGPMDRLEKVLKVVDHDRVSTLSPGDTGIGLYESENGIVAILTKTPENPQVPVLSAEGFVSNHRSSILTHALDMSGVRKEEAASDRQSSTFREVRAAWTSPELQLNDWVSRRGDSEVEDGRLAHPGSSAESYPSPTAESIRGAFPFSYYGISESCVSDVLDSKSDVLLHSSPNNVMRITSHVKDLEPECKKSSEEEYSERVRIYDEYLADPSLSPTMRSQVLRAKATLERLLYDSD